MTMKKFYRKPESIKAVKFDGNLDTLKSVIQKPENVHFNDSNKRFESLTSYGWILFDVGYMLVENENGELLPYKEEAFNTMIVHFKDVPEYIPVHLEHLYADYQLMTQRASDLSKELKELEQYDLRDPHYVLGRKQHKAIHEVRDIISDRLELVRKGIY